MDNKGEDEYGGVDWKVERWWDWLEVREEIGEGNGGGKVIMKSKCSNEDEKGSKYEGLERSSRVKIMWEEEGKGEIVLNISECGGIRSSKYGFEGSGNIGLGNVGENSSSGEISNVKGYEY